MPKHHFAAAFGFVVLAQASLGQEPSVGPMAGAVRPGVDHAISLQLPSSLLLTSPAIPKPVDLLFKTGSQLIAILGKPDHLSMSPDKGGWMMALQWRKGEYVWSSELEESAKVKSAARARSKMLASRGRLLFTPKRPPNSISELATALGVKGSMVMRESYGLFTCYTYGGWASSDWPRLSERIYQNYSTNVGTWRVNMNCTPFFSDGRSEPVKLTEWLISEFPPASLWGGESAFLDTTAQEIRLRGKVDSVEIDLSAYKPDPVKEKKMAQQRGFALTAVNLDFKATTGVPRMLVGPGTEDDKPFSGKLLPIWWWTGAKVGDKATVSANVPDGKYMLMVRYAKGVDMGIYSLAANGVSLGAAIDAFDPNYLHGKAEFASPVEIRNGALNLTVTLVGENPQSRANGQYGKSMVGIVGLRLKEVWK